MVNYFCCIVEQETVPISHIFEIIWCIITPVIDLMIPIKIFLCGAQFFPPASHHFDEHQFHEYFFLNFVQMYQNIYF